MCGFREHCFEDSEIACFGEFHYMQSFVDRGVVRFWSFGGCWFFRIRLMLVFGRLVDVGIWRIPWMLVYRGFRGCWFSVDLESVDFRVDSVK